MPQAQAVFLTHADYLDLPDDGRRYEIIRGRLHVSPSPLVIHQMVLAGGSTGRPTCWSRYSPRRRRARIV